MKSALSYFLAARQCEIGELERLAASSSVVAVTGRFTHALQRERGISDIFLASRGERFAAARLEQIPQCELLQAEVLASFETLASDADNMRNARLLNRIAVVLDGLPRQATAQSCDLFLPLQPGTDVMLFHGLLHIMLWEGWLRQNEITSCLLTAQGDDAARLSTLQALLKCGTQCGSCVPISRGWSRRWLRCAAPPEAMRRGEIHQIAAGNEASGTIAA